MGGTEGKGTVRYILFPGVGMAFSRPEVPQDIAGRLSYELAAQALGFRKIGGIDEAGRGPLAGPVVAACVILPEQPRGFHEVRDSKKLTPAKRRDLYMLLHEHALGIGIGLVDAAGIDRLNILEATFLAMRRAVESLAQPPDYLLIDGNRKPQWAHSGEAVVNGDGLCLSIAAASIVAKVTRDRIMEDYDSLYPQWGFGRHKGYGTVEHLEAIRAHGICELHRRSFQPIAQQSFSLP